ncbi:MAG: hypothetical protein V5B33_04810 [Candidatus Accumulibacter sp. UW20]
MASPESVFLKIFFTELGAKRLRYAVMRNYDSLPESAGGSDLDILVAQEDVAAAVKVLLAAIAGVNGKVIGAVQTWTFFEVYVMGFSNGQWWGLCVELYSSVSFKSAVPLVDLGALYKRFELRNNVSVIPCEIGNTIGYIKEILAHGALRKDKPQYQKSANLLMSQRTPLFHEIFHPLGSRAASYLADVLNGTSPSEIAARARKFRFFVITEALARTPFRFLFLRVGHEFFRLRRFFRPPGAVVAILGVDGAGKSTVIQAILPSLKAATHNAVFVLHLRPGLLPPLARLKGRKETPAGIIVEPHGSKPSGFLGSLGRLVYLSLDYLLGYWLIIRPRIAKRPAIVIFDRYAYDMGLDPSRFRIGVPGWVAGWFAALVPQPDLIICLHGSPEIIAARKRELPLEETRRQVEALRAFVARRSRAVLIATDTSVEETRDQVLQALGDVLRARSGLQS